MKTQIAYRRRSALRTVFYVYTEAYAVVFMLICALIELLGGLAMRHVDPFACWLGLHAAPVFAGLALVSAAWVYHDARKRGIIMSRSQWSKP